MMKNFTLFSNKLKTTLLIMAAMFSVNAAFAETGSETEKDATIGSSNQPVVGQSYTVEGTYNAGAGGSMAGDMTSKGFKMRTGSDGNRCVFTVNPNYTITSLVINGISNYAQADGAEGQEERNVFVTKVEVDDAEVSFTGGEFPVKGSDHSGNLTISGIRATSTIAIYFDSSNSAGKQVNTSFVIDWERPDASQPTITVSPESVALIPGTTYQMSVHVDPNSFATFWKSSDEAVATVDDSGLVTTVGPGVATISNVWADNQEVAGEATITVANFEESALTLVKTIDFTSMESQMITLAEDAAGNIWNEVNKKVNPVYFATNAGLEDIALQMVTADGLVRSGKGWILLNNYTDDSFTEPTNLGLYLATGAGRCAAVGNLKEGQIVEINYSGSGFYTRDKSSNVSDDGVTKVAINEGVGRAIYQVQEDGMLGFEIDKGNSVYSIIIYEGELSTGVKSIEQQPKESPLYNVLGQQVKKAAKGLFIQNGKKFIVK